METDNTKYDHILKEVLSLAEEYDQVCPELTEDQNADLQKIKKNIIKGSCKSSYIFKLNNVVCSKPRSMHPISSVEVLLCILMIMFFSEYVYLSAPLVNRKIDNIIPQGKLYQISPSNKLTLGHPIFIGSANVSKIQNVKYKQHIDGEFPMSWITGELAQGQPPNKLDSENFIGEPLSDKKHVDRKNIKSKRLPKIRERIDHPVHF